MIKTITSPLLHIENVTMLKALKDPAMIFISTHWSSLREGVYIDEDTFRIDLFDEPLYSELRDLLEIENDITTIYIYFSNIEKRSEFIQVFLNKILDHGLVKVYGDIGFGRLKQTQVYKKRSSLMKELI